MQLSSLKKTEPIIIGQQLVSVRNKISQHADVCLGVDSLDASREEIPQLDLSRVVAQRSHSDQTPGDQIIRDEQ